MFEVMREGAYSDAHTTQLEVGMQVRFGGRILFENRLQECTLYGVHLDGRFVRVKAGSDAPYARGDIILANGHVERHKESEPHITIDAIERTITCAGTKPNKGYLNSTPNHATVQAMFDPRMQRLLRQQAAMLTAIRRQLDDDRYIEVMTPTLVPKAFPSTAKEFSVHYHGKELYLKKINEPQLKMHLLAGFERVYEIGKVFRNEGDSPQFLPEFANLDALASWVGYDDVINLGVRTLRTAAGAFDIDVPEVRHYHLSEFKLEGTHEEQAAQFKKKIAPKLGGFFIVDGYPASKAPTAKLRDDNPQESQEFRIFVNKASCIHGYMLADENDGRSLAAIEKAKKRGLPIWDDFETHLNYGLPPSGGIGIGLEKLVQLLTGKDTIREVQFFRK